MELGLVSGPDALGFQPRYLRLSFTNSVFERRVFELDEANRFVKRFTTQVLDGPGE